VDGRWVRHLAYTLTDWNSGFPPAFLTLMAAAALWLRGVLDGNQRLRRDDVWSSFAAGFAAFALLLIAGQLDPGGLPPDADRWLIGLVASGLAALALASVDLAHISSRRGEDRANVHLNRDWLVSVVLVVGGVLVIGLALGALVTPATVGYILGLVGWLLRWVGVVVGYVLLAILYVVFLALTPLIEWLQARMAEMEPREGMGTEGLQRTLEELTRQPALEMPPLAEETLRWLTLAGIGIVLLIIFALALRYFRNDADDDLDETRETVFSSDLLQEQLAALWNSLLQRLRRSPGAAGSRFLSLDGEAESRAAIRALYQAVLDRATTAGYGRAPGQTPYEYKARLMEMVGGVGQAWTTITEIYVAARYGRSAPPHERVEQMQTAWTEVETTLAAPATDAPDK
jgi:MFS family permease